MLHLATLTLPINMLIDSACKPVTAVRSLKLLEPGSLYPADVDETLQCGAGELHVVCYGRLSRWVRDVRGQLVPLQQEGVMYVPDLPFDLCSTPPAAGGARTLNTCIVTHYDHTNRGKRSFTRAWQCKTATAPASGGSKLAHFGVRSAPSVRRHAPSARSRDKIRLVPNLTRAMFSTVNMISTIESRRPADRGRSREFAPRAASGPRRRGTGGHRIL